MCERQCCFRNSLAAIRILALLATWASVKGMSAALRCSTLPRDTLRLRPFRFVSVKRIFARLALRTARLHTHTLAHRWVCTCVIVVQIFTLFQCYNIYCQRRCYTRLFGQLWLVHFSAHNFVCIYLNFSPVIFLLFLYTSNMLQQSVIILLRQIE